MANQERGEVPLEIGGRTYTLVLNTKAIASIETHLASTEGRTVTWEEFWTRVLSRHVASVVLLLWGAARRNHREMTIDQAADLIDEAGGLQFVRELVAGIKKGADPDPADVAELTKGAKPKKPERPRRARTGAGLSSSASLPA